jgi:hypothetical protein
MKGCCFAARENEDFLIWHTWTKKGAGPIEGNPRQFSDRL